MVRVAEPPYVSISISDTSQQHPGRSCKYQANHDYPSDAPLSEQLNLFLGLHHGIRVGISSTRHVGFTC